MCVCWLRVGEVLSTWPLMVLARGAVLGTSEARLPGQTSRSPGVRLENVATRSPRIHPARAAWEMCLPAVAAEGLRSISNKGIMGPGGQ